MLADFDDCVSLSHSYKRIPYNIWRNLKHQSTLANRVYEVEFDDEIEQIQLLNEIIERLFSGYQRRK